MTSHRASCVLLVDDDPEFRSLLRDFLEEEGCCVTEAENGLKALERLQTLRPDLILVDLMMPEMSGWEFLEALRSNREWADIPVGVVSAVARISPPGAVHLIGKPINLPNLLGLLDAIDAPRCPSVRFPSLRLD